MNNLFPKILILKLQEASKITFIFFLPAEKSSISVNH